MYTIIMNSDKSLTATVRTTLYQREKLADKIQFLIPETYGDMNLADCIAILKYTDIGNEMHSEPLAKDIDLYKGKLRYILPIDTKLNRFAGNIVARISFLNLNGGDLAPQEILHTGETIITVNPVDVESSSVELTDKIYALEAKVYELESRAADDLIRTDDLLQLSVNGQPMGAGVVIETPDSCDCEDGVPVIEFTVVEPENPNDELVDNIVEF